MSSALNSMGLSGLFNFESHLKYIGRAIVIGAIGYAVWHTGIAAPLIEAATPWITDGLRFLQIDHVFSFAASLIPDYAGETVISDSLTDSGITSGGISGALDAYLDHD